MNGMQKYMAVGLTKILLIVLFASPVFAQCDSLKSSCDSLVNAQEKEIFMLRDENARNVFLLQTTEKFSRTRDSLNAQIIRDGIFERIQERKEVAKREQFFLVGFALLFITSIFIHIR